MKTLLRLIFVTVITFSFLSADCAWVQKSTYGGAARFGAVSFVIGSNAYVGTGRIGLVCQSDFWKYNPAADTWTQIADCGGSPRTAACSFSIGSLGYVGIGIDTATIPLDDLWAYDAVSNTWTQRARFPMGGRNSAVSFSVGSMGYIGTGFDSFTRNFDFWQYNPATNSWQQKANLSNIERVGAIAFNIDSLGYVGLGIDGNNTLLQDFWQFKPTSNTWTQKADYGGVGRTVASAFSLDHKGYVGCGDTYGILMNDFWAYDPQNNTWDSIESGPDPRSWATGFSIGHRGYILLGTWPERNDVWEYNPNTTATTTVEDVAQITLSSGPDHTFILKSNENIDNGFIKMYDVSGKLCFQKILSVFNSQVSFGHPLGSTGIYFWNFYDEDKLIAKGKVFVY